MNPQINFSISKSKEKELFNFIVSECGCRIYKPFSINDDYMYKHGDEINLEGYFISPFYFDLETNYEKHQLDVSFFERYNIADNSAEILIFRTTETNTDITDPMPFYCPPIIEYQRMGFFYLKESDEIMPSRFYIDLLDIHSQYKNDIKNVYTKLKKWIKSNAVKREREGILTFYLIK